MEEDSNEEGDSDDHSVEVLEEKKSVAKRKKAPKASTAPPPKQPAKGEHKPVKRGRQSTSTNWSPQEVKR